MKSFKLILLTLAVFLLAGCSVFTPVKPEIKTKYVLVEIPEVFVTKCETIAPPFKEIYMAASLSEREGLLVDYSLELSVKLKGCSDKINSIRDLQIKQRALYPTQ